MKKLFTVYDLLLLVSVAAVCLLFLFLRSTASPIAIITVDGNEYMRIELSSVKESYELDLPCTPPAALLIEKDGVSFCEASCRDKLCMGFGKLTKSGDTAACLPARVIVAIVGGEKPAVDAIT